MNLKIVLAGAASALLVGTFAVAQTTTTPAPGDPATPSSSTPSGTMNDQSTTGAAASAVQYSADTAAQTGDTSMAGERG